MEFGERLKQYRKEKGISQQALADAIFVSRSAVAKWENGLGLPSEDSHRALLEYFGISAAELPMHEDEQATVVKNRRIREYGWIIACLSVVLIMALTGGLLYSIDHGFGFTSEMAAGEHWRDEDVIHTPEYDFYWYSLAPEGDPIRVIDGFCAVQKTPIGYQKIELEPYKREVVSDDGKWSGILYSFQGSDGWHHIFRSNYHIVSYDEPMRIVAFETVRVKEDIYPVEHYSYFVTDFELTDFWGGDRHFTVRK